jgi:hypothetical protein
MAWTERKQRTDAGISAPSRRRQNWVVGAHARLMATVLVNTLVPTSQLSPAESVTLEEQSGVRR